MVATLADSAAGPLGGGNEIIDTDSFIADPDDDEPPPVATAAAAPADALLPPALPFPLPQCIRLPFVDDTLDDDERAVAVDRS